MIAAMRIARSLAIQHGIEHPFGGLAFAAETATFYNVSRSLKLAPHADQPFRYINVILNSLAPFRMSNDHLVSCSLQFENSSLV